MHQALLGSSSFPQEANYILNDAPVSQLLRFVVNWIVVPCYKLGRRLKLILVRYMLWNGRRDIVNFLNNTTVGLNRVIEKTKPNSKIDEQINHGK